eukprot:scaffold1933_cov165-Amphora_coffeaeformis.AAC.6
MTHPNSVSVQSSHEGHYATIRTARPSKFLNENLIPVGIRTSSSNTTMMCREQVSTYDKMEDANIMVDNRYFYLILLLQSKLGARIVDLWSRSPKQKTTIPSKSSSSFVLPEQFNMGRYVCNVLFRNLYPRNPTFFY